MRHFKSIEDIKNADIDELTAIPEITKDAAEEICKDLAHPEALSKTREEFLSLSGESGAASRLCDIVLQR